MERQNSFRPVFGALLRASRSERQRAAHLRRLLAENNINYDKLKGAFEDGAKEGLEKVLKSEVWCLIEFSVVFYWLLLLFFGQIPNPKETELKDLLEILDCYFDPEKKPIQPKPRFYQQNNNNNNRKPRGTRKSFSKDKNSESGGSPNAASDNAAENLKNKTVKVQ